MLLLCSLLLCSCRSSETRAVDKAIKDIGEVTLKSEKAIADARRDYDRLSGKEKDSLKNADQLFEAEADLLILQVVDAIDNLPRITLDVKDTLVNIRDMYDSIPEDRQDEVENYKQLIRAEDGWNEEAYAEAQRLESENDLEGAYEYYSMLPDGYEERDERMEALSTKVLLGRQRAQIFGTWVWDGTQGTATNGKNYSADFASFTFYENESAKILGWGLYEEYFAASYDALRTDADIRSNGALDTLIPGVTDLSGEAALDPQLIYKEPPEPSEDDVVMVTDYYSVKSGDTIQKLYAMDFHLQKDGILRVDVTLGERNKDDVKYSLFYVKQQNSNIS